MSLKEGSQFYPTLDIPFKTIVEFFLLSVGTMYDFVPSGQKNLLIRKHLGGFNSKKIFKNERLWGLAPVTGISMHKPVSLKMIPSC